MMEPPLLDAWAAVMWKACWQGSIVVLAVWLICRIMPSMPARCRCWLWRLVILKFVIVLLLPTLVNLPLLPARSVPDPIPDLAVQIANQQVQASPTDQVGALSSLETALPSVRAILAFLWIVGVGWSLAQLLVAWRGARQLRRQSHIIDNTPLIEQLAIQARVYGLRGSPALLESEGNGSPMLIGILRPAIVVPGGTFRKLNLPEIAMVLGHELAHIRRSDLLWNLAAACVQTVFFFHPLVWLSQQQLNLAQEVAADELAILRQHHDPASYGTLLVSVISRLGPSRLIPTMSMGTAGSVQSLTRRLVAMASIGRASRGVIVASGFPWRQRLWWLSSPGSWLLRNLRVRKMPRICKGRGKPLIWKPTGRESQTMRSRSYRSSFTGTILPLSQMARAESASSRWIRARRRRRLT